MLRWNSWPHIRQWSFDEFSTFQTQRQKQRVRESCLQHPWGYWSPPHLPPPPTMITLSCVQGFSMSVWKGQLSISLAPLQLSAYVRCEPLTLLDGSGPYMSFLCLSRWTLHGLQHVSPHHTSLRWATVILSLQLGSYGTETKGKFLKVLKKPVDAELTDTLFKHMKGITAIQIAELKSPEESISFWLISTGIRHCLFLKIVIFKYVKASLSAPCL